VLRRWCFVTTERSSRAKRVDLWVYKNEVKSDFSRPGKPTDNAFRESFNGTFRSECLDTNWFSNLEDARQLLEAWRRE
jgi:putative transposase